MKMIQRSRVKKKWVAGMTVSICLYIALMMVQTPIMQIGRITAISTILLVIVGCFVSGRQSLKHFFISEYTGVLVLYSLLLFLTTIIHQGLELDMLEVIAMLTVTVFLCGIMISPHEDAVIRYALELAVTIYAILAIRSCVENANTRYYHGAIPLFGTYFDPNYIGIPFVAGTVLQLDNILTRRRFWISGISYIILAVALVYTASRGNMVSWLLSNAMVMYYYLRNNKIQFGRKAFWGIVAVFLVAGLVGFLSEEFEEQWIRMTTFGEGSDNGRLDLWGRAFSLWLTHPFFGAGYNSMYFYSHLVSHNTYIQILAETGLVGFVLMAIFACRLISRTYREDRTRFCMLIGMFAQIAFLDTLGNRCVWAILAWCVLKRR